MGNKIFLAIAVLFLSASYCRADPPAETVFAGGCFWCMQPPFDSMKGVIETEVGYSGGAELDPTYEEVSAGRTDHYEAIRVKYDPKVVAFSELVELFWRSIDPTQSDGQFCDRGDHYRSALFVAAPEERTAAEKSKNAVEKLLGTTIVTPILESKPFYRAEEYHQQYYKKEPERYKRYRVGCGRDRRLEVLWGRK